MKKTVTVVAILASASMASAIARPTDPTAKPRTICLAGYTAEDGSVRLATCDSARNNALLKKELLQNGCAEGQASITTREKLAISSCFAPGVVQL